MKRILIRYTFHPEASTEAEWHDRVKEFTTALAADAGLRGRITYTCMKAQEGREYVHIADVADDDVTKMLGERDYFRRYTEATRRVGGGKVTVTGMDIFAETHPRSA